MKNVIIIKQNAWEKNKKEEDERETKTRKISTDSDRGDDLLCAFDVRSLKQFVT